MVANITTAAELALRFGWPEYVVFGVMLVLSAAIGVFFAFYGGGQNTTDDVLLGGRKMQTIPMALSLIASFMSAITMLGTPAEMYNFGTMYWMIFIAYIFVLIAAMYLYMPVFFEMGVTSAYQYLEERFSKPVRILGSIIFTIQMCLYMAIVVYAPALALNQVTGVSVDLSVGLIFLVCTFYTALGGMKAVIWTDTIQAIVMYGSLFAVIIKGSIDVGGVGVVWERNRQSGRLEFFDFNPDPTIRHTFWSLVVGGYFMWIAIYGVNQAQVQRYISVPSVHHARRALWINVVGLVVLVTICCYGGLVIFARYHDCDPLSLNIVKKNDQLFPLFVMETLGEIPGLPGLFVAGIFSGSLSTVSSGLNSLAAITLEDFVLGCCVKKLSPTWGGRLSKLIALGYGVVCYALVFVAKQLGGVLGAALSVFGLVGGPLLGVFTLGMFFPWANSKGALIGTITSFVFMLWIGIGTEVAKAYKQITFPKKPVSIAGCPIGYGNETMGNMTDSIGDVMANMTTTEAPLDEMEEPLGLYRLSYLWYSATGCATVVIVGLIVSFFTGFQDPRELNPILVTPPIRKMKKIFHVGENFAAMEKERAIAKERVVVGQAGPALEGEVNPTFNDREKPNGAGKSDKPNGGPVENGPRLYPSIELGDLENGNVNPAFEGNLAENNESESTNTKL